MRWCCAIGISLLSVSETSAQTAVATPEGFNASGGGRTITVIDDSGTETIGKLVRFTPEVGSRRQRSMVARNPFPSREVAAAKVRKCVKKTPKAVAIYLTDDEF